MNLGKVGDEDITVMYYTRNVYTEIDSWGWGLLLKEKKAISRLKETLCTFLTIVFMLLLLLGEESKWDFILIYEGLLRATVQWLFKFRYVLYYVLPIQDR